MVIYAKDTYQLPQKYINNNKAVLTAIRGERGIFMKQSCWSCRQNEVYNQAIDDFVEKVELKYLGVHPDELYDKYYPSEICKQIKVIAEQLKGED